MLPSLRLESLLQLGQSAGVIAELETMTAAATLDEGLHHLLMRALASAGRRNDALATFARFRTVLRDELGTSPSALLVGFNTHLLQGDHLPASIDPAAQVRIGIREPPNRFLGRENDISALERLVRESRVTTILGPGGLGKTRLAQELAHAVSDRAVIVVELASVRTGEDVTLVLGSTLGIREASTGTLKTNDPRIQLDVRERILTALRERQTWSSTTANTSRMRPLRG